jgi:DNA (cytosine-5)-methyltransferase 1
MAEIVPIGWEQTRPIAIDLFAGAGGLSLGAEQAGFDVVSAVEYDPVHCAVHAFNFPRTSVLCADAAQLSSSELRASIAEGCALHARSVPEEVDLVVGGPPCPGFSLMGKRELNDPRNDLVFHFLRAVAELRPRYFIMENVPGMIAGAHAAILKRLLAEFRAVGYPLESHCILNACDFGVPQDRKRLFLMGARADQVPLAAPRPTVIPVLKRPSARSLMSSTHSDLPRGPSVWEAIGDLPDADSFPELLETDEVRLTLMQEAVLDEQASAYALRLRGAISDHDLAYPRIWDKSVLTSSMRTTHTDISRSRFAETLPGQTEAISHFYRLHPQGLSNTLRAGTGSDHGAYTSPRPIHPLLPRVITVREAARLHSLPDWFRLHRTKWHGMRQIGNAVAPAVAHAVTAEVVRALALSLSAPKDAVALGDPGLLGMDMTAAAQHFGASREQMPRPRRSRPKAKV